MAKKTFEMGIQIGAKTDSSFSGTFSKASGSLQDLKKQSKETQRELDRMGREFRQGKIHQSQYTESTERLTKELKHLENAQKRISSAKLTASQGMNTVKSTVSQGFNKAKMAGGIVAVGTAAAATAVAFKSMNTAADFESKMAAVGAKTEATASEMKELNKTALKLGADTSLSAGEVAVSMDELAAKGFDVNKIIGAMPGIISAAEASGEDLALTSDTVATAINVWSLEATEASRVADVLAMSANVSAAGIEDLAQTFKYAGAPAAALGISLEEVSAAAGIMTDAGLEGGNAGTSLRASLLALNNPAKAQEKIMKKLGFSIKDSKGHAKSLSVMIGDLAKSTEHMSEADKVATVAKLVGTEAVSGFLALIKAGPQKIDEMTKALENSEGTASRAAAKMKDNYAGAFEEMSGSFESSQIAFATPILPVFQDLFKGIGASIDDNVGGIEQAGERVAAALRDVFEPFSATEPVKPKLMDASNISNYNDLMEQYHQDVDKFNKYDGMDFGDKFVYMLDTASAKAEQWLSGSGGDSMQKIFTELGEIAAKAWLAAFTTSVKSAGSNLMDGNVMPALGMGAAAYMLGGGAMVKGAYGLGKWGYGTVKGAKATKAAKNMNSSASKAVDSSGPVTTSSKSSKSTNPVKSAKGGKVVAFPTKEAGKVAEKTGAFKSILGKSSKVIKPLGKVAGKAFIPLQIAASAMEIYSAKDKKKATVEAGAGLAGGLGGAKLGAAIGTMIAPGIGTAVGGVLGGIVGYAGAKWVAGKAVDKTREFSNEATVESKPSAKASEVSNSSATSLDQPTANLKSSIDLSANNFKILGTYAGEASGQVVGAFTGIKTSADLVKGNLDLLTMYTGEANGWLVSLNGIQTAGEGVISALRRLERRIDNIELPGTSNKRVSYNA